MYNFSGKYLAKDVESPQKVDLDMSAFWNYVDMMYFSPISLEAIFCEKVKDITQPSSISLPPTTSQGCIHVLSLISSLIGHTSRSKVVPKRKNLRSSIKDVSPKRKKINEISALSSKKEKDVSAKLAKTQSRNQELSKRHFSFLTLIT